MKSLRLKKIGMELGSNSPVIVLADCKLDDAVEANVSGAFWACGQNCIGVQRIYIERGVYKEFCEKFAARTRKLSVSAMQLPTPSATRATFHETKKATAA